MDWSNTMNVAGTIPHPLPDWHAINWRKVYRCVRRLQARIVKAVREGRWGKVHALRRILTRSLSTACLAVRRVTEARGKKTPGVDGVIWSTPKAKQKAVLTTQQASYTPLPLRRVYRVKDNGRRRPLGIPVMGDRARQAPGSSPGQALYLQVLEPIVETLGDPNSPDLVRGRLYGFRPKRQCADAIGQCFNSLRQESSATLNQVQGRLWILEGDIEGFFDNIFFSWMLEHIPMNKRVLSQWLHSGFMDRGSLYPTTRGVPQGGVVSPVIGNMVLDGLEQVVLSYSRFHRKHNINFVRFADDFIATANNREVLGPRKK